MSFFVIVNWFLVFLTSIVLASAIWADRSLLVKPSIMAILFFHVMCQWGTAIEAARIESYLPDPWIFVMLSHGFPLVGLTISLFTWRKNARSLLNRLIRIKLSVSFPKNKAFIILLFIFLIHLIIYLSYVPIDNTGLYAIIYLKTNTAQARELSAKLLDNQFVRYTHSFMTSVYGPLLAVFLAQFIFINFRQKNVYRAVFFIISFGLLLMAVSISGARAYSAYILLTIIFAEMLRRGVPLNPIYITFAIIFVLAFPTLISLMREDQVLTLDGFLNYLRGVILDRVTILPMETGLWHVHYAQVNGFLGFQGIPRLAAIMGIESINLPNLIALEYSEEIMESTTANTAYIYAYYSYFGSISFLLSLIGLWLLDLSLIIYRSLSDNFLLPCVACISMTTNVFSNTEYTIALFSQGFLVLLFVSWVVDLITKNRFKFLSWSAPNIS